MKNVLIVLWLVFPFTGYTQSQYMANDHVGYKVDVVNNNYHIQYTFKDHLEQTCTITWNLNKEQTDKDINKFGIPKTMFDSYPDTPEVRARRKQILKNGLFKQEGNYLVIDKDAVINTYSNYFETLADWMIGYLRKQGMDTRIDRIRLAMRFVQDIPYAVPDDYDPNWYYAGVISPPNVFTCGYGDCDTKAIIFAGILCHLIDSDDIRFAGEPGHTYTIIKNQNLNLVKGGKTTYFELDDGNYVVAETAGPGRLDFGQKGDSRFDSATLQKVNFIR